MGEAKVWRNKRKENPPSWAQLTLPAVRLAMQSAFMEVVQPLSLAVRPSGTSRVDAANGQLKNSHPLNVRKNFFPHRLYLGRCTRAHATRCLASHLPSYLNSSSAPLHSASPSHNPPFAPSNYNSINQSFAVTMATAMLGTGPRVACGHQPAIDHDHLLHQNKANLI